MNEKYKTTILIGAAAVLITGIIIIVINQQYARIESFEGCRARLADFNEEQIINEANDFFNNQPDRDSNQQLQEQLDNINLFLVVYLKCYDNLKGLTQENYDKAVELIGKLNISGKYIFHKKMPFLISKLNISEQSKEEVLDELKTKYTQTIVYKPFLKIASGEKEEICPQGKEDPELVEAMVKIALEKGRPEQETKELFGSYCDQIEKYSKDEESLNKEIYEFRDWAKDIQERKLENKWKAVLAFRFGGAVKAKKVCDNLAHIEFNAEERKECDELVESYFSLFTLCSQANYAVRLLEASKTAICRMETR